MRQVIGFVSAVLLTATFQHGAPTRAEQSKNPEAEKQAILDVINNESRTFYRKDHAAWSQNYVHSPKVFWVCVEEGVTLRAGGWNDLSAFVAAWMKENPKPLPYEAAKFPLKNVQITLSNDLAFVSLAGASPQPDGSVRHTVGSRTMRKENGAWKILAMASYPSDSPKGSTANVYVHRAE